MTNIDTTDNIQIDGTKIEKVTNLKYMGQTIARGNRIRQEFLFVCLFLFLFLFFSRSPAISLGFTTFG